MSLAEETLSTKTDMPFTSCQSAIKTQQVLRDEINNDIARFLRNGGKIDTGAPAKPVNDITNVEVEMAKKRKRAHTAVASKMFVNSPIAFHDGKNRANDVAASGHQNIYTKMRKAGIRHTVIIGKTAYGTFSDIKEALAMRDEVRKNLGMEPAYY